MTTRADYNAYKYQWARYVARQKLVHDVNLVKERASEGNVPGIPSVPDAGNTNLRDIARDRKVTFGKPPAKDGELKVGIIGAGCA